MWLSPFGDSGWAGQDVGFEACGGQWGMGAPPACRVHPRGKLDEMGPCGMLAVERGLGKVGITVDEHADWAGRI